MKDKDSIHKPHEHDWGITERRRNGVLIKLHGCRKCKTLKAYDMQVINPHEFQGQVEYQHQ